MSEKSVEVLANRITNVIARSCGLGGESIIREEIAKLAKLCKEID